MNEENKIDINKLTTPNPLFRNLPAFVKNPKNFQKIEKALLDTLICPKSHSDVLDMSKCLRCTRNMLGRRALMKKFGFDTPKVYREWKKIIMIMMRDAVKLNMKR